MSTPPEVTPPAADSPGPALRLRWAPVVVVLLAWIAHLSAIEGGWLLDDVRMVRDDVQVAAGWEALPRLVTSDWFPSVTASGSYGPLVRASFALEGQLWRKDDGSLPPEKFHYTNLLLHGLCAWLLFRVLVRLLPRRPVLGLAGAVCFAVHPLHAGTVGALMGRAELLALLFSLLAVLCWRAYGERRPLWLPLAALCWLLALLCKEVALGLPLALFVLDLALPPRREGRPARGLRALAYATFLVPLGIFASSWGGVTAAFSDVPVQPAGTRVLLGFEALGRTLLQLVIPVGFRGDHTDEAVPGTGYELDAYGWAVAGILMLLSAALLVRALAGRGGFFTTVWLLLLALALPAFLGAPAGAPLEHRFAYLVTLPLLACAGLLLEGLTTRAGRTDGFALARGALLGCLAMICLVGLSHREAGAWLDDSGFHDHLLERNPQHVRAMVRLARYQRMSAQELRRRATALAANSPERLALLAQRRESLRLARAWSARAVRHELGRSNPAAWRERGYALLASDLNADALRALERALAVDPRLVGEEKEVAGAQALARARQTAEVHHGIGRARAALGRRESAADAFLMAARTDPERLDYAEAAGLALCRAKRYAEGIGLLRRTLGRTRDRASRERLEKAILDARVSASRIGAHLLKDGISADGSGKWKEAIGLYEQAIAVNPKQVDAYARAGYLRGWYFGQYRQAFSYLDEAVRLLDKRNAAEQDPLRRRVAEYRRKLERQMAEEEGE